MKKSQADILITPLGEIEVLIDDIPILYDVKACENDVRCRNLDGRYLINIHFNPDGKEHTIKCRIINHQLSSKDKLESGENLELKSFYSDKVKLSIGMESESDYFPDGTRVSVFDYDGEYLENGVQYVILPNTKTTQYVFGIAWINEVNEQNEVQTWYGADPALCSIACHQ